LLTRVVNYPTFKGKEALPDEVPPSALFLIYTQRIILVAFPGIASITERAQIAHLCFSALRDRFDVVNMELRAIDL
jgi:hypothetical protein